MLLKVTQDAQPSPGHGGTKRRKREISEAQQEKVRIKLMLKPLCGLLCLRCHSVEMASLKAMKNVMEMTSEITLARVCIGHRKS